MKHLLIHSFIQFNLLASVQRKIIWNRIKFELLMFCMIWPHDKLIKIRDWKIKKVANKTATNHCTNVARKPSSDKSKTKHYLKQPLLPGVTNCCRQAKLIYEATFLFFKWIAFVIFAREKTIIEVCSIFLLFHSILTFVSIAGDKWTAKSTVATVGQWTFAKCPAEQFYCLLDTYQWTLSIF